MALTLLCVHSSSTSDPTRNIGASLSHYLLMLGTFTACEVIYKSFIKSRKPDLRTFLKSLIINICL